MYKNISIKNKIISIFTLVFSLLVAVAFFSYFNINNMNKLLKENKIERFPKIVGINKVIDNVNEITINIGLIQTVDLENVSSYSTKINLSFDNSFEILKNLENSSQDKIDKLTNENITNIVNNLSKLKTSYLKIGIETKTNRLEFSKLSISDYIQIRNEMMKTLHTGLEYESKSLDANIKDAQNLANLTNKSLIIVVLLGLLLSIIIGINIIRDITIPLDTIVEAATKISHGDFNFTLAHKNNDEISKVEDALENMVYKIQNLNNKFDNTTDELIRGNLNVQFQHDGLEGVFLNLNKNLEEAVYSVRNIVNISPNINLMVGDIDGKIVFLNDSVKNLLRNNQEDIRKALPHFNVDNLVGNSIDLFHKNPTHQHNVLKYLYSSHKAEIELSDKIFSLIINPNLNSKKEKIGYIVEWAEITSVTNFDRRLKKLIEVVANGDLSYRIKSENIDGVLLETANNINQMLGNIQKPFDLSNSYLNNISNGILPSIITEIYLGDFDKSKESLNNLISTLSLFKKEMDNMSSNHEAGFISRFIDTNQFIGIYKEIALGVNNNVKSHIETNKNAMNVLSAIASGEFTADLDKLPNEKAFINDAIDGVRNSLYNFNNEINKLLNAAKNGELAYRANTIGFKGGWNDMAIGLNELMDEISLPLDEAGEVLSYVAKGDLTVRMNGKYNGEFENLKNNLNYVTDSLEQVIKSIIESVSTTATTANQLAMTAENMSASAQQQSSQTDDVASAVEEMSRTISDNAQSSAKTLIVAEQNGQIANEGGDVVGHTVSKMKDIATVVQKSALNIEKLGESSKEIGEIISVIDDIADQTNLLALNAAIEAARAGEQGRGFAVVADEVRKLAERTTDATKRIAKMIKGIQTETIAAVTEMNKGNIEVQNGINLADKAGQSLLQIVSSSNEVYRMINQISVASEEQSSTSEEISKNVVSISKVIAESALQIEEIAKSSEDLSRQTKLLTEILGQFKIKSNHTNYNNNINQLNNLNTLKMLS